MIKKIVITGPESTGKTSLAEGLAEHYKSIVIPEYARIYLDSNSLSYTYDDLLIIAKEQVRLEDELISRLETTSNIPFPVFMDTDLLVLKIWCEHRFNSCHPWILDQLALRRYDLYLLCDTDLPWVYDPQREATEAGTRDVLFRHYHEALIAQNVAWNVVTGDKERQQNAINAIDKHIHHIS